MEARVVFQKPLNHNWSGVAPAQLIFSGHHFRMSELIPHAAQVVNETETGCLLLPCPVTVFNSTTVPNIGFTTTTAIVGASNCTEASGHCTLEQLFPTGIQVGNARNIYTAEIQLPTPWVTFNAKFYRGNDMRFSSAAAQRRLQQSGGNLRGRQRRFRKRASRPVRLRGRDNSASLPRP